jgi:glycosyltransferase 2 family protein
MVLPARLAEFVRPYLLQQHGASFSSSFGAVLVERFFDLTGLMLLLGLVLWKTPRMDPFYSSVGAVMLVLLSMGYAVVLVVLAKRELVGTIVERCLSILPARMAHFLGGIIKKIIDGLGIMASFRQALILLAYSVALWVIYAAVTYSFLLAFSIEDRFLVAVTIQVVISLGVALPTAPGFIGTFHFACRYALGLFGVEPVAAISLATVYHLFSLILCLILGIVSYTTGGFRFDHPLVSGGTEPAAAIDSMGNAL